VRKSAYKKIRHGVAWGAKNTGSGLRRSGLNGAYPGLTWPMQELVIDGIAELLLRCSRSLLSVL